MDVPGLDFAEEAVTLEPGEYRVLSKLPEQAQSR
jgi:hypothetical protein